MIEIGLNAVIVSVADPQPQVLTIAAKPENPAQSLPFGPFDPTRHRTFEIGLREWVEEQTALKLGYVEQLYTFGDRGRHHIHSDAGPHVVSVGYLALARQTLRSDEALTLQNAQWRSWYSFFPWEDWRSGMPAVVQQEILPALEAWTSAPIPRDSPPRARSRGEQVHQAFNIQDGMWNEERVLDRYELLYEAGLLEEARRDGRPAALKRGDLPGLGQPMLYDHRRILATAISRLRTKLKYRPLVFELMPHIFTLTDLQRCVEAISGRHLHKQNFRRLVEKGDLVEPTGETSTQTGGRPAALFRFRHEVLKERPALGLRVGGR
ncbi:NAD regulator [Stappia sp. MMSF_3263]|uniref:NUDIX hydrolase n=1 Tax=Stappia sp. MMSF_3263 TaxID=3046693 RepID=UPI0027402B66|nr:NAD regulator [Stappia sp. MMSF_3263]